MNKEINRTENKKFYKNLSIWEKMKCGYNPMAEGVRWIEKYSTKCDKVWKLLPNWVKQLLATLAVFILASGIQGRHAGSVCVLRVSEIILYYTS